MSNSNQFEPQYHLYYRSGKRDHITKNGQPVCSGHIRTPSEDDLKPLEELTDRELLLLTSNTSNLCTRCMGYASRMGLFEDVPDSDIPEFACPECGESAQTVSRIMGIGYVEHEDGERHEFDFGVYQKWRRGEDSAETEPT